MLQSRPDIVYIFSLLVKLLCYKDFNYMSNKMIPYHTLRSGGGGGLLNPPPPKLCPHAFNSGATLLCVGAFSPKIVLHCVAKKKID